MLKSVGAKLVFRNCPQCVFSWRFAWCYGRVLLSLLATNDQV